METGKCPSYLIAQQTSKSSLLTPVEGPQSVEFKTQRVTRQMETNKNYAREFLFFLAWLRNEDIAVMVLENLPYHATTATSLNGMSVFI